MSSRATTVESAAINSGCFAAGMVLRPLQWALAFPSVLYLAAMTIFLFRPPDLDLYHVDRIAFGVLIFVVALRILALREKIPFVAGVTLPMLALAGLALLRALRDPFEAQTWSLVASKFLVPLVLFHLAILVFRGNAARRQFEIFVMLSLAYLVFIAVAFLADARWLIFPKFILNESLGIQAERARGPFLQAVANGMALNILGIIAIAFSERHRKVVLLLCMGLPFAILATMTRAVWIGFAVSIVALAFRLDMPFLRRACLGLVLTSIAVGAALFLSDSSIATALGERAAEPGPIEARLAVYDAAWDMFQERPLTGWNAAGMYSELARRMPGYHLKIFFVHNTYLALLIEFGIPGLAVYALLFFNLFRLGRSRRQAAEGPPVKALRRVWPILLCIFLFNAFFVDMAYQFVIGLMFTVAGMLYASAELAA